MSVWCHCVRDDVAFPDYEIDSHADKTDLELLQAKAQSHEGYGWTVVWLIPNLRFSATKVYADGGTLARERIFEIR